MDVPALAVVHTVSGSRQNRPMSVTQAPEARPNAATAEIAHLGVRAVEYAAAARAPSTRRAYEADLRHYFAWTDLRGLTALPAAPETVALYVTSMASELKASTIVRRLSAISVLHGQAGIASPTHDPRVRSVVVGIRRSIGASATQVAPATIGEIRRMVAHLDDGPSGTRDRALLLVGFAAALRRSELASLTWSDLVPAEGGVLLWIRRSKSDQEGRGDTRALPIGSDLETCPVSALETWKAVAGSETGNVFRPVDRNGRIGENALSGRAVAEAIKRAAARCGLDPALYSGHSLRAGFVTTAAARGASERSIARQTGHAPNSTVLRTYVRHASAFCDNAVAVVGL